MRAIQLVAWVIVIAAVLLPLLRRRSRPAARTPVRTDELVKDPVCQTYVVRSRAIHQPDAAGEHYFCSAECARRYDAGMQG